MMIQLLPIHSRVNDSEYSMWLLEGIVPRPLLEAYNHI
jgi:hypothetical protein